MLRLLLKSSAIASNLMAVLAGDGASCDPDFRGMLPCRPRRSERNSAGEMGAFEHLVGAARYKANNALQPDWPYLGMIG
jgi:hypothetical protein